MNFCFLVILFQTPRHRRTERKLPLSGAFPLEISRSSVIARSANYHYFNMPGATRLFPYFSPVGAGFTPARNKTAWQLLLRAGVKPAPTSNAGGRKTRPYIEHIVSRFSFDSRRYGEKCGLFPFFTGWKPVPLARLISCRAPAS
jgi:hypothetical protein